MAGAGKSRMDLFSASFKRVPPKQGRRAWIAAKRNAIKAIESETLSGIIEEPEHALASHAIGYLLAHCATARSTSSS